MFGALSSNVIRDYISANSQSNRYVYDIDDENDEFKLIIDIFNFNSLPLNHHNAEIIKDLADDLQIDCILKIVNPFIMKEEKVSDIIDDHLTLIDSIEEIFDSLYKIEELTVDSVASLIKESQFSKTEKGIYELAAFFLQVVDSSIRIHPYLADLLIKLNEKDKQNKLELLVPFISEKLLDKFSNEIYIRNNIQTKSLIFPFVYQMYERNLVPKEKVDSILTKCPLNNIFFVSWFQPELKELNKNMNQDLPLENVEEYKQMRDKGEFDDEILNSIRNDDVDTFQSIMSKNYKKLMKNLVRPNMFDPFINRPMSYINYAAAYGSIKCFKYMLLNNEQVDGLTLKMAILSGNIELIRIIDNQKIDFANNNAHQQQLFFGAGLVIKNENTLVDSISTAIKMHKNDIFDWILEQKADSLNKQSDFPSLVLKSVENGNAHALVQLIDKGFNFSDASNSNPNRYPGININNNNNAFITNCIQKASANGFYSLISILIQIYSQHEVKDISIEPTSTVSFHNIHILKLLENKMDSDNLKSAFIHSVQCNYKDIIEYFFNFIVNNKFTLYVSNSHEIINIGINSGSKEYLDYLIDKIASLNLFHANTFYEPLKRPNIKNYRNDNANKDIQIYAYKKIAKLIYDIDSKSNFTISSFLFYQTNLKELITFYIENKFYVDYIDLSRNIINNCSIDLDIFPSILDQIDSENRKRLIDSIDLFPISKPKPLIEFLLNENASLKFSLIQAVSDNDLDLVEKILNKNSEPSFINQNFDEGTVLNIASKKNNVEIVKKLLSIPGIDPSIYDAKYKTPLINSIHENSCEIFNNIFDFYKEDIKNQKWQLEEIIKIILGNNFNNTEKDEKTNQNANPKLQVLNRIIKLKIIDPNFHTTEETLLTYAIKNKSVEIVEELLQYDTIDVNLKNPKTGDTPLIVSIINKNETISKLLIQHPKIDLNLRNNANESPLILAVYFNTQDNIIKLILDSNKVDPNVINAAFIIASPNVAKQIMSLKTFDPNYTLKNDVIGTNIDGNVYAKTPFLKAVSSTDDSLLDLIVHHPSFKKDDTQINEALYSTILKSKIKQFKKLLELFDIDVNSHAPNEDSLLMKTIKKYSDIEFISTILNNPKFDSKKSDIKKAFYSLISSDKTDFFARVSANISSEIMDLLYKFDKEHDHLIDLNEKDNYGISLLNQIYNSFQRNESLQNELDPLENSIIENKYLLSLSLIAFGNFDYNAHLMKSSRMGLNKNTYLHLAAEFGRTEIIKEFLTRHLYDINTTNSQGNTALIVACKYNKQECVKFLFENDNLDFLHKNNNGNDAIHLVMKNINIDDENDEEIKNKDEYLSKLLELMKKLPNYNNQKIDNDKTKSKFIGAKIAIRKSGTGFKINHENKHYNKRIGMGNNFTRPFGFGMGNGFNQNPNFGNANRFNQNPNFINANRFNQNPNFVNANRFNQNPNFVNANGPKQVNNFGNANGLGTKKSIETENQQLIKKEKLKQDEKSNGKELQKPGLGTKKFILPGAATKKSFETENQQIKKDGPAKATFSISNGKFSLNLNGNKSENNAFANKMISKNSFGHPSNSNSEKPVTTFSDKQSKIFSSQKVKKLEIHNESFNLDPDPNFKKQKPLNENVDESTPSKSRKVSRSMIDYDFDDDADLSSPYQPQNIQQLMILQRQQQQWFQLIQMNNQYQAQLNLQMMNNQAKLSQSSKKKKRRSKK